MTTQQPLILDLFCCAGGASKGYHNAGFQMIGVDISPQPHYPFGFVQADAIKALGDLINGGTLNGHRLEDFDAIHASPPCQAFSGLSNAVPGTKEKYPNLIPQTRTALKVSGKPYVIENVPGSPLDPTVFLCGSMFGRRIRLHRLFETNFPVGQPACDHSRLVLNPYNVAGRKRIRDEFGADVCITDVWRKEKGVWWMNNHEASESIMPAFTEHIGAYLLGFLDVQEWEAA